MATITAFEDQTGKMSQDEINSENIQNIIAELNRNSSSLDALNNNLAIISKGSVNASLVGGNYSAAVNIGTTNPGIVIASLSRPDIPGKYFILPYVVNENPPTPTLDMVIEWNLSSDASNNITLDFFGVAAASYLSAPATITLYYYVFSQPINPAL